MDSGRGGLHVESTIDSHVEVIDRFGLRLAAEPPDLLTSRLDTLSIRLRSSAPRLGPCLENRAGLDLCAGPWERSAEAHHRPYVGSERAETAVRGGQEYDAAILPRGAFELEFESVDICLLRATFVLFDTVLSSMRHHQVLCLSCMLSVLVCTLFKAYLGSDPLKTCSPWFPS